MRPPSIAGMPELMVGEPGDIQVVARQIAGRRRGDYTKEG